MNESLAMMLVEQLRESIDYFAISVVGYVVMPSHFHGLLGFPEVERMSHFMQSFKSLSSKRIKEAIIDSRVVLPKETISIMWRGGEFRLWRPRFDDLIITSEDQFRTKLQYIYNNPLKAGLVDKPEKWQFSSAKNWLTDSEGLLPVDKSFVWQR
jgi:putative transposase